MNKYQIEFLKKIIIVVENTVGNGDFEIDNEGNLLIIQNKNYNITSYVLKISNKDFSSVSYLTKDWVKADIESKIISIPIDFNNQITKISFEFNNGLVDNFEINVNFKKSDKNKWDIINHEMIMDQRLENINVELGREETFHTVIFMPCCMEYSYSVIKWYAISRISHSSNTRCIGGHDSYSKPKVFHKTFLEKVEVRDKFYCNIECAFKVAVEVKQYDKDGNLLVCVSKGFEDK